MATSYREFRPEAAVFAASAYPQYRNVAGTNFPVTGLYYDATSTESGYWEWTALKYGAGNITLDIIWYADTATTGAVRWEAAIAAITPDTDSQDVETKALATAQTVDSTHLGTVGQRLHRATIAISNLDTVTVLDEVWLKVSRLGGHANDTMAGDAVLVKAYASYSDT